MSLEKRFGNFENYSYNDAVREFGSTREFDYFYLLWSWSTIRNGGIAGRNQDKVYNRKGWNGLLRRINRIRKLYGLPESMYKFQ